MRELVGSCIACNKEVYCIDGFFYGVHTDEREIYCFECYESTKAVSPKEKENP